MTKISEFEDCKIICKSEKLLNETKAKYKNIMLHAFHELPNYSKLDRPIDEKIVLSIITVFCNRGVKGCDTIIFPNKFSIPEL